MLSFKMLVEIAILVYNKQYLKSKPVSDVNYKGCEFECKLSGGIQNCKQIKKGTIPFYFKLKQAQPNASETVETVVGDKNLISQNNRFFRSSRGKPRWALQVAAEIARVYKRRREFSIIFGETTNISSEEFTEIDMKSVKDRPPTPVPSKTKLAEVTFNDRIEDLPDPVALPSFLPERNKLLEMINVAARLMLRSVNQRVMKGMDVVTGEVTLPNMRHPMEWGEAVESLAGAVVDNRVNPDSGDVRRTCEFLTHRILCILSAEMKEEKRLIKMGTLSSTPEE